MAVLEWVCLEDIDRWKAILSEFRNADIYYSPEYSLSFQGVSEGKPYLLYFQKAGFKACNVVLLRQIEGQGTDRLYDLSSQYGYGGWIFQGLGEDGCVKDLLQEYERSCVSKNIISEVIRLHPVCSDMETLRGFYEPRNMGSVIVLDICSEEVIWQGVTSKNRNVIRKAEGLGVTIKNGGAELISPMAFKAVYDETMKRAGASEFYFFSEAFHESFDRLLADEFKYFAAYQGDDLLAVAIITHKNGMLNYHLSGTTAQAKGTPAMNLLLYHAAVWGAEKGYKTFNLGGGVGASQDSLFKFKKAFTRGEPVEYLLLTKIFNVHVYESLVNRKVQEVGALDRNYFPQYRAPALKGA